MVTSLIRHTPLARGFHVLDVLVERAAGGFEGRGFEGGAAAGELGIGEGDVDAVGFGVDGEAVAVCTSGRQ